MKIIKTFTVVAAMVIIGACNQTQKQSASNGTAEAIYYGGDIITMEGESPQYAEALAVGNGKILFVGAREHQK
jgi:hypothetical protein